MLIRTVPRLILIAVIASLALLVAAPTPGVDAAGTGKLTVHARMCPVDGVTTSFFNNCHQYPAGTDFSFRLDSRSSRAISAAGNITWGQIATGTHTVTLTSVIQPNEFLGYRVFCSVVGSGQAAVELPVISGPQTKFKVYVTSGTTKVCDVYFIPESGKGE